MFVRLAHLLLELAKWLVIASSLGLKTDAYFTFGTKGGLFSFTLLVRMCSYLCFEKGLKFRTSGKKVACVIFLIFIFKNSFFGAISGSQQK